MVRLPLVPPPVPALTAVAGPDHLAGDSPVAADDPDGVAGGTRLRHSPLQEGGVGVDGQAPVGTAARQPGTGAHRRDVSGPPVTWQVTVPSPVMMRMALPEEQVPVTRRCRKNCLGKKNDRRPSELGHARASHA